MHYFSVEQGRTFLRGIEGDPLEAFYVLALTTGMRRGELLALHWVDVDLKAGYAQVRYTLQDQKGGVFCFAAPKTSSSRRRVRLNSRAALDRLFG